MNGRQYPINFTCSPKESISKLLDNVERCGLTILIRPSTITFGLSNKIICFCSGVGQELGQNIKKVQLKENSSHGEE